MKIYQVIRNFPNSFKTKEVGFYSTIEKAQQAIGKYEVTACMHRGIRDFAFRFSKDGSICTVSCGDISHGYIIYEHTVDEDLVDYYYSDD